MSKAHDLQPLESCAELSSEWVAWIYEGVLETLPWRTLLEQLRGYLNAQYVSLAVRSPSFADPGLVVFAGEILPHLQLRYEHSLYQLDPFFDLPVDQLLSLDERLDHDQWHANKQYAAFLNDLDIGAVLGANIEVSHNQLSRLRITRGPQMPSFNKQEKTFCTHLLQHLKNALRLYRSLDTSALERDLYAHTLESLNIGVLLLDARGDVLQVNKQALKLLGTGYNLHIAAGRLQALNGLDERNLTRAITHVLAARVSQNVMAVEALSIGWPGKSLGVLLRGLAPINSYGSRSCAAIEVILRDAQDLPVPCEALLRQLFQFTAAEAALAVRLCHGDTLEQAALGLHISRNTVRAHLRVIFSKTGVARQTTLVQLLLGSVAALNPLSGQRD